MTLTLGDPLIQADAHLCQWVIVEGRYQEELGGYWQPSNNRTAAFVAAGLALHVARTGGFGTP